MLRRMWHRAHPERPLIVAHRAGTALAPDDQVEGVRRLIAMGVEMVEIDVRATGDGVLVVHHDDTVDGALLKDTDSAMLSRFGRRVPRLDELLDVAAGRVGLDVELKETGLEAAVLTALRSGANTERVVVTSFEDSAIAEIKRLDPTIATGLIVGSRKTLLDPLRVIGEVFPFGRLSACRADFLVPARALLTTGLAARAGARGVRLLIWTVNDPREAARLLRNPHVLGIVTDSPELLAASAARIAAPLAEATRPSER